MDHPFPSECYRVVYLKTEGWNKASAWEHLQNQLIPGCPKKLLRNGIWGHGWVKDHGFDEWAWVYWWPAWYPSWDHQPAGKKTTYEQDLAELERTIQELPQLLQVPQRFLVGRPRRP